VLLTPATYPSKQVNQFWLADNRIHNITGFLFRVNEWLGLLSQLRQQFNAKLSTTQSFLFPAASIRSNTQLHAADNRKMGLLLKRNFIVQVFVVEKDGSYQYRSVIFPADRLSEGSLVCEKWHTTESEIVRIVNSALPNIVDAKEILGNAQSIEGWMRELELTDSEATLLGWKPELLGD
jgi:hypothetical protein